MLHVELRQGRHQSRAFNLSEDEALRRFLLPFVAGRTLAHADREWEPRKVRLTVYAGPELGVEQMGMGRGWANVQKDGRDVTGELLARARARGAGGDRGSAPAVEARPTELDRLRDRLLGRLAAGGMPLAEAVTIAENVWPDRRVSERLAAAELVVWELLHHEEVVLVRGTSEVVEREGWQAVLLDWESWASPAAQATERSIIVARSPSEANR